MLQKKKLFKTIPVIFLGVLLFAQLTDNTSFYPCESLTNYFSRASYGARHMTGNVFHYTAKGTIASYETTDDGYETMNSPTLIPWIIILEHSPTNTDTAWDSRIIINMD